MARPRMRPSFKVVTACSGDQLMEAFRRRLAVDAEDVVGAFSTRHGVLRVPEEKRRFWTPCLELTVEDRNRVAGDGAAATDSAAATDGAAATDRGAADVTLWGTFSPRPEIWTGFVFAIGTLGIVSVFSGVYGVAQLFLGHAPFALLVPFVAVVLAVLLYLAALVGQGLSISEMYRMRAFVDDCLREAEAQAPRRPRTARESSQL